MRGLQQGRPRSGSWSVQELRGLQQQNKQKSIHSHNQNSCKKSPGLKSVPQFRGESPESLCLSHMVASLPPRPPTTTEIPPCCSLTHFLSAATVSHSSPLCDRHLPSLPSCWCSRLSTSGILEEELPTETSEHLLLMPPGSAASALLWEEAPQAAELSRPHTKILKISSRG